MQVMENRTEVAGECHLIDRERTERLVRRRGRDDGATERLAVQRRDKGDRDRADRTQVQDDAVRPWRERGWAGRGDRDRGPRALVEPEAVVVDRQELRNAGRGVLRLDRVAVVVEEKPAGARLAVIDLGGVTSSLSEQRTDLGISGGTRRFTTQSDERTVAVKVEQVD